MWNYIGNQVDQQTDTLLVRATLPNPERQLVDGAFVTVEVKENEEQPRLVIPRSALQLDQAGIYVLVVNQRAQGRDQTRDDRGGGEHRDRHRFRARRWATR